MKPLLFIIPFLLLGCKFAPAYDPVVNQELSHVVMEATDLKSYCPLLTVGQVHSELTIPATEARQIAKYRSSVIESGAHALEVQIGTFEVMLGKGGVSKAYCQGKLDDISNSADALMKGIGAL